MNLIESITKHLTEAEASDAKTYVVLIDKSEGGNDSKEFTDKDAAIRCGEECAKAADTLHVEVVEVNDDGEETVIKSIPGPMA